MLHYLSCTYALVNLLVVKYFNMCYFELPCEETYLQGLSLGSSDFRVCLQVCLTSVALSQPVHMFRMIGAINISSTDRGMLKGASIRHADSGVYD